MLLGFVLLAYFWCWTGCGVQAYIPASPSNDTSTAIASGLNLTDVSNLYLQWYKNGFYTQTVSYELVKTGSDGISKGALVHFSEAVVRNDSSDLTTTPWIALVACDFNATHASQEDDIFTLARDRGAVGPYLLYSEWSQACIVNPEYADPNEFEQVMDIYSTQSLSSARLIDSQFAAINVTVYGTYDPQRLNESQSVINDTLQAGYPTAPGYLWATLAAWNATADPGVNSVSPGNGGGNGGGGGGSPKTTLAMIILYAITGCVSAMFCVVIITGAIRAIRHPERYRVANMTQGGPGFGEGRGGALARAVLDTFPIIKFGRDNGRAAPKDVESGSRDANSNSPAIEMKDLDEHDTHNSEKHADLSSSASVHSAPDAESPAESSSSPVRRTQSARQAGPADAVTPDNIGRETCPICIVDFEEGDDLRVLPCEGKHKFHQACVDPWLLELSSSCPICRQDFQALETMLAGEPDDNHSRRARRRRRTRRSTARRASRATCGSRAAATTWTRRTPPILRCRLRPMAGA